MAVVTFTCNIGEPFMYFVDGMNYLDYPDKKEWHRLIKEFEEGQGSVRFIKELITKGFKHIFAQDFGFGEPDINRPYSSKHNWLGVSRYAPDQIFKLGDKEVIISLQGLLCASPPKELYKVMEGMGLKYIAFRQDGKLVWETFTGELPPDWVMKQFTE